MLTDTKIKFYWEEMLEAVQVKIRMIMFINNRNLIVYFILGNSPRRHRSFRLEASKFSNCGWNGQTNRLWNCIFNGERSYPRDERQSFGNFKFYVARVNHGSDIFRYLQTCLGPMAENAKASI
jgi:hypothetical protein